MLERPNDKVFACRQGTACFYCYKPIDGPLVSWLGDSAEILLHPQCAIDLCIRLMRDVHEWQCSPRGELPPSGKVRVGARHVYLLQRASEMTCGRHDE